MFLRLPVNHSVQIGVLWGGGGFLEGGDAVRERLHERGFCERGRCVKRGIL